MEEKLIKFRELLTPIKDKYDDAFNLTDRINRSKTIINEIEHFLSANKWKDFFNVAKVLFGILFYTSTALMIIFVLLKKFLDISYKEEMIFSFVIGICVCCFIIFLILYIFNSIKARIANDALDVLLKRLELPKDCDLNNEIEVNKENIVTCNRRLEDVAAELDLLKETLSPYVTEDFRNYDYVCRFILLVDNSRTDSFRDCINMAEEEVFHLKLISALTIGTASNKSTIDSLLNSVNKLSNVTKKAYSDILNSINNRK